MKSDSVCSKIPGETIKTKGKNSQSLFVRDNGLKERGVLKNYFQSFPGGSVVKNLPANAGDMGLIPDLGRSPMLWSN